MDQEVGPMSGLRFPRVMPAWWYRDPAEALADRPILALPVASVSCGTSTTVHAPARDHYYTQARRLHIRQLIRNR